MARNGQRWRLKPRLKVAQAQRRLSGPLPLRALPSGRSPSARTCSLLASCLGSRVRPPRAPRQKMYGAYEPDARV